MNILWVDDQMHSYAMWLKQLGQEGLSIVGVDNGNAALEKVKEGGISVAILDVEMPGMDGVALTRELAMVDRSLAVIFLSGYLHVQRWQDALNELASENLYVAAFSKPLPPRTSPEFKGFVSLLKDLDHGQAPPLPMINKEFSSQDLQQKKKTNPRYPRMGDSITSIMKQLSELPTGRQHARTYQLLITRTLEWLLYPALMDPHVEAKGNISRYDIVFFNKAESGFWRDLKLTRGNAVVIFEAKNKMRLEPTDADQVQRYSGKWRGQVVFLVTRQLIDSPFRSRTRVILQEFGVCILVISNDDLQKMVELKLQGADPTLIIEEIFRKAIETS
jgi:CheY-like chemotaxis protein